MRGPNRHPLALGALVVALLALTVPALAAFKDGKSAATGPSCLGLELTISGTGGDDRLRGTPADDVIGGLGGDDRIIGGGGLDVICGGSGKDFVTTGKGPDKIAGSPGDDKLLSRQGPDIVYGLQGNDLLNGGPGFDRCFGGQGKDLEKGCEKDAPPLQKVECKGKGDGSSCPNSAPGAVSDSASTDEDTAKAIDPLANDSDVNGDALKVISVDSTGTRGAVMITGDGSGVEFDPRGRFDELAAGQNADDSFAYTISDGNGHTATATVAVSVGGVDDAPKAVGDSIGAKEDDASVHADVLANDTDVDGGPKAVQAATDGAHGTVTVSGDGNGVDYEPDAEYCGSDSFTYTLNGGSTATVAVEIECIDDAPVAVDDSATVQEDDPGAALDVLANDTDTDGGPKKVESVTQPADGTVTITGGGSGVSYAPDANYCNEPPGTTPDTFTYTLNSGSAPSGSTATVSVKVDCVDDGPVAVNDTKTVAEDSSATAIDVLANDTDIDGGPKKVEAVTQPTNGTVVITGGGTGLTYAPAADYCNEPPGTTPDSFEYTLNGGSKGTVAVKVTCADDAPLAVNDTKTVAEDSSATAIAVLANDTDVDGGTKTVGSVTQPANGSVTITGGGSEVSYAPDANYCNEPPGTTPDTFTYTLNGGSTATVSVKVECVDDAPAAVNDSDSVEEDSGATAIAVLANDTDIDGGTKKVESVTQPADGTVVITGGGTGLTYEPDADYCDEAEDDTFTYTLNGGSTATVSVEVECVEDEPGAVNDSTSVEEDSSVNAIDVLANDTDPDGGSKTIESVTQPTNGTVVITGGGTGLTYEPDADYCDEANDDTFTYTLNGGSTATVSVEVECVEDAPVAVNDTKTVEEDSGANTVTVLANDTDVDGGAKTIESVTQPANGTVAITGGGAGLTYEPDANYCNEPPGTTPDTFEYTLNSGSTATVSVKVECVDDAPVAVNDSDSVEEDSGATAIDVLANDTDVDGGSKTIESVTQPANGTVAITGGGTGLTYEPDADYCDEAEDDSFEYTLNGGSTATVSVEVECVIDSPTAVNDSDSVEEDSGATAIDVLANDTNPDNGTKTIESVTQPANGTVVITGGGTGLTYEPDANYCNEPPGTTPDTFAYEITGGSEATVAVKVECVNDDPTDLALSKASLKENEAAGAEVGAFSTTDVDPGDTFTYSLVAGTGSEDNGSFEVSGNKLKAKASFNFETKSSYSVRVRTTDSGGKTFEKQLTITVENANDPPTALALTNDEINENEPAGTEIGALSTTDEDVGETFTYSLVSGEGDTDNGSFEVSGNKLKAKASFNFETKSSYSVRVRTTDSGGKTFEKELTITVLNVNDAPTAVSDTYSGAVGNTTAVLGNVVSEPNVSLSGMSGNVPSANDSDEDAGDTISVVAETVSSTGGGTVMIDADGTFTYKPGVGDKNQTDSFTYKVTDGEATSNGTVSVGIEDTLVWYVNGSAASEGDGRSATPYKVLSGINGAGGAGDADGSADYVFLYGANTYSGGLPLETSQKLIGSPHGLSVPNHPNLVAASGTNPVITNAGGNAIALASGSEIQRVNATNASGVGISGTSVTTATVGSNTIVSGNSSGGVVLSGVAGGDISIGSTIESQNGSVASVSNRNSGTVTFSGNITSANGGVSANSNSGANIAYTGTLNLTRTSGETFAATGGGSVKATGSGNKATTTGATAVRVTGTTIASGGVNFQSVNSTGAANGIVLENTGSTAGLTISGTGSAGSGGTITTSTGPGILLTSTSNVSLASIKVTNGGDDGIRGSSVSGFSLTGSSEVTGNGNAVTENGLDFVNLTGTVNLTKATVSASGERNVAVVNETGTVNATFLEGTYSNTANSATGGDAIFFEGTNSGTINATIEKATFTNNRDDHVQVTTDASNTTTENVTIKENTMSNTVGQPGGAVTLNPGGNATMEASVLNNTITGARIEGITVDTPGSQFSPQPAQVDVTISGNTVGNQAVSQSGSSSGNAVGVRSNGAATVDALITNNNLSQYVNANGLLLVQNDGSGTLNATVRGNTITKPDPLAVRGMRVEIGADIGDKGTSCLDIGGAGALVNNLTGSSTAGNTNLRLEMNGEATAKLAGYGGGAHEHAAVQSYLAARNTAPDGVSASQFDATSNYSTAASCPLP